MDIERRGHEEQLRWGTLTMKKMFADWAARHKLSFICAGSSSRMSPYTTHRHPSPQVSTPPLPSSSASVPWASTLHRTSISRDDMLPSYSPHHQNASSTMETRQLKPEQLQSSQPPSLPLQSSQKDSDDDVPSTSDFVRKFIKCDPFHLSTLGLVFRLS